MIPATAMAARRMSRMMAVAGRTVPAIVSLPVMMPETV
jgi:hypothetical protein